MPLLFSLPEGLTARWAEGTRLKEVLGGFAYGRAGDTVRPEEVAVRLGRVSNASGVGWSGVWPWLTRKFCYLPLEGPLCLSQDRVAQGPHWLGGLERAGEGQSRREHLSPEEPPRRCYRSRERAT